MFRLTSWELEDLVAASQERAREESRSLQDLSYVIFEELFEDADLIRDITEVVEDPISWKSGHVHNFP